MSSLPKLKPVAFVAVSVLGVAAVMVWFGFEARTPASQETAGPEHTVSSPLPGLGRDALLPENSSADQVVRSLWRPVDEASLRELPFYAKEWSHEGRVLVRVSDAAAAARSWRVGDRLTFPLPQLGATYHSVIEGIDEGPGYSRAAFGKIPGEDGRDRRVVITVGPTSMFAYIETPKGTYELNANRNYGWLLPTTSIMAGFDFSQPDYILPNDMRQQGLVPAIDESRSGNASGRQGGP